MSHGAGHNGVVQAKAEGLAGKRSAAGTCRKQ